MSSKCINSTFDRKYLTENEFSGIDYFSCQGTYM